MQLIKLNKEPNISQKFKALPYQDQAVKTICDLEYAAVFHEQGLGKSKIAIDVMLYWIEKKYVDTVLIVAKKGLINNWVKEMQKHIFIKPLILTQNKRDNYYVFNSPSRLMLAHYEALKLEKERFKIFLKARNVAVILDESTKIKNPNSALTNAFIELAPLFKKRIIMTGLPVANRPFDIWSQIYFLDHGKSLGGNFEEFRKSTDLDKELNTSKERQGLFEDKVSAIYKKISAFTVRETKNSGIIKLPDKVFQNIITTWESRQQDIYCQIKNELRTVVMKGGIPVQDENEEILKRLLRLIQVSSNPKMIDENYLFEPGKNSYLNELVTHICSQGEKCIIWSGFIENVDELAIFLNHFGVCKIHGKLNMEQRNKMIESFMSDQLKQVLIATPGAAKEGLTLTVANHAIFYDRGFSLDDYLQAQDRIHRISQTKTCYVYNLIMEDSIDQWIDALLRAKELAAKLAQGDISVDYFKSQISYNFYDILQEILDIKRKE